MPQHFLLSAKARTLSLRSIFAGGEDAAYKTFREMRWPDTNGEPICPHCGSLDHYVTSRKRFACIACRKQYSVTSGTIFASRKMKFVDLVAAICIVTNSAKGISALQLARDIDCQHKTAFVLAHKLREAIAAETKDATVSGDVEIDGMYTGGSIRPANLKEERIDRRLAENQTGKRRVVIAVRQRRGRTLTFVTKAEHQGVEIARRVVEPKSRMYADEAAHWDELHAVFETYRINHSDAYSFDGVSTNQVESFFARLRRMIRGQHHHVSPRYLHAYAAHAAWLEDHRRMDNGALCRRALGLALDHAISRQWKGYWQRRARAATTD